MMRSEVSCSSGCMRNPGNKNSGAVRSMRMDTMHPQRRLGCYAASEEVGAHMQVIHRISYSSCASCHPVKNDLPMDFGKEPDE